MTLPQPSDDALAISRTLATTLAAEIADNGGWIPFSRFMEQALYAPGLGYYTAGSRKFGEGGDFVTAPELSPLFAQTLARQLAALLPQTAGHLLEFGAGTGRLAADLLAELEVLGQLPASYTIVDLSPDLIERQRATLAERVPHLASRVQWAAALPAGFDGIMLGNEVLDAMPVQLLARVDGVWHERGVIFKPNEAPAGATRAQAAINSEASTASPRIRQRSSKRTRCGEV